jgi:glucose/arabinose dehydrogenase
MRRTRWWDLRLARVVGATMMACGLLLVGAAPCASASTASVSGAKLKYSAASGESNDVLVTLDSGAYSIADSGAVITAGAGCTSVAPGAVTCSATGVGSMSVSLGGGNDAVTVSAPTKASLNGGSEDDHLTGGAGADSLLGGPGNDTLQGSDGDDTLDGGAGDDSIAGAVGTDTVSYTSRKTPVGVTLDDVANDGETSLAEHDNVASTVENSMGGSGNDTLIGSAGPNTLSGGPGDDTLQGSDGDDTLDGGAGDDSIAGAVGTDTVSYTSRKTPVGVTLDDVANDGETSLAEHDNVASTVENIVGGSGNDTLIGSAGPNTLTGRAGDDRLDGGAGPDVLNGSTGADMFSGADGAVDKLSCGAGSDGFQADPSDSVGRDCEERLTQIGTFVKPLDLVSPPGDPRRQYVVEQGNKIWAIVDGQVRAQPFLDLSDDSGTLLALAFAPDYATSGRFYVTSVHFDSVAKVSHVRLEEFQRSTTDPELGDISTRRPLLDVPEPTQLHNGGQLQFGPDGLLYVSFGDGGPQGDPDNHAQDLESMLGKILRIDPNPDSTTGLPYSIPANNPFVGRDGLDEIYSYGLRNPWRFSFDGGTGDLYVADPGENRMEEVDYERAGAASGVNFGWSCYEGTLSFNGSLSCPGARAPVYTYPTGPNGDCAVIGGNVYRGTSMPSLTGRYLFGDYCSGRIRSFRISAGTAVEAEAMGPQVPSLSSFGEDASGNLYLLSLNGPIYRLGPR